MRGGRERAIRQASSSIGKQWGVVLGTLGRQGNLKVLSHVESRLACRNVEYSIFLLSELSPTKIALFEDSVEVWVQIACPRLSIDWGEAFAKPLLTPYEVEVALGFVGAPWIRSCSVCSCKEEKVGESNNEEVYEVYPMDYYARDGGPWNSSYALKPRPRKV
jgi:2-(3-amino-3-carboxypropyl)histidine synthase